MSAHLMGEIVASDLKEILGGLGCEVRFEEYLSAHTTFQVGGPADALALPKDEGELLELLERCRFGGLPVTVLGGGANTLVRDGGVRGVVISLARGFRRLTLREETKDRTLMEAGAGVKIPALVRFAVEGGWEGVECLSGVPGTVGGALAMNAGTADHFIGDAVESARWIRFSEGGVERLPSEDIRFGYRSALFPEPGLVSSVVFRLARGDKDQLRAFMQKDARARRKRQPWGLPCAGSIFRNPPGGRAGLIIEALGLKGHRAGGAEVSRVHGNFIVNRGGATASDVISLIDEVKREVRRRNGANLDLELQVIGEDLP
jgi:UDP-N-acetylmuramate dehydrogenase